MDELKEGDVVFVKSIGSDATITKRLKKSNRIKIKTEKWEIECHYLMPGVKRGRL